MILHTPEDADRFFKRMKDISLQMSAIFGEGSDAYEAVQKYNEQLTQGKDVVIIFTEHGWVVGPRPSWDILGDITRHLRNPP